jgi:hypothetical protein
MRKKLSLTNPKLGLLGDIISNSTSWSPAVRNGWLIKFSVYKKQQHNILLFITSTYTAQTFVRYFTDEDDAINFINFIIEKPAELEIPD